MIYKKNKNAQEWCSFANNRSSVNRQTQQPQNLTNKIASYTQEEMYTNF